MPEIIKCERCNASDTSGNKHNCTGSDNNNTNLEAECPPLMQLIKLDSKSDSNSDSENVEEGTKINFILVDESVEVNKKSINMIKQGFLHSFNNTTTNDDDYNNNDEDDEDRTAINTIIYPTGRHENPKKKNNKYNRLGRRADNHVPQISISNTKIIKKRDREI